MQKLKVQIDNKSYDFQVIENFDELSQQQYVAVIDNLQKDFQVKEQQQVAILIHLISGKVAKKRRLFDVLIRSGQLLDLLYLTDFVFKKRNSSKVFVKVVRLRLKKWYAPANNFSSMKFGEFIALDMLFTGIFSSQFKESVIYKFVAYYMRPKKRGVRIDLDSEEVSKRLPLVKRINRLEIQAIIANYNDIRESLANSYPYVFGKKKINKKKKFAALGNVKRDWLTIRSELRSDMTKLKLVDNMNVHEVLRDFEFKIKSNEQI